MSTMSTVSTIPVDSEDECEDDMDYAQMEACRQERMRDEDITNFSFWMSEHNLPLPIESWDESKRAMVAHPPLHRLELLQEAAEYYVNIYGGTLVSVLAEMIVYYN
mgnify:CR=1 FL=1